MSTPLASVFVEARVDTSKMPEDIRKGLSSGTVSSSAATAGKKTGVTFGENLSKGTAETGGRGTQTVFEQAEKGAVTSGLGIGKRAGLSITRGLGEYAKIAGATVAGYFAAEKVKEFFTSVIEEGTQSVQTERLVAAAIQSTGGAANVTAEDIDKLAKAQSAKIGVDDDTIKSAEAMLLRFQGVRNEVGKGNDIFNQSVVAAEDLSAAYGTSLTSAMRLVGRAVNDPIHGLTMLTRVGITFTDQQKATIQSLIDSGNALGAQKLVIDQLGVRFGGAAEAVDTPMKQLETNFKNFEEELGVRLLPIINEGANLLGTLGSDASKLAGFIGEVPAPLRDTAFAMLAFKAASSLGVFNAIGSAWTMLRVRVSETGDAIAGANLKTVGFKTASVGLGIGLAELSTHAHGVVSSLAAIGSDAAIGAAFGPWGAAIGAGIGLLTHLGGATKITTTDVDSLTDSLNKQSGAITHNTATLVANTLEQNGTFDAARTAGLNLHLVTEAALGNQHAIDYLRQAYAAYSPVVAGAVANNQAAAIAAQEGSSATYGASQANDKFAKSAKTVLENVGAEAGAVADARRQHDDLKDALHGSTEATKQAASAEKALASAARDAYAATLKQANSLLGKRGDFLNYKQSLLDITQGLKENGKSLDENTAKGIANNQNFDSAAQAILQYATHFKRGSEAQVDFLRRGKAGLVDEAAAFFDTRKQAQEYIDSILKIPTKTTTQLEIDRKQAAIDLGIQKDAIQQLADWKPYTTIGVATKQAISDMNAFKNNTRELLDSIPDEPVNVTLTAQASKVLNELDLPELRAAGGPITGGTAGRDSVHILGTPGEHMLTVDDVNAMGGQQGVFAFRRALHMADGGPVVDLNAHSQGFQAATGSIGRLLDGFAKHIGSALSSRANQRLEAYQPPGGGDTSASGPIAKLVQAIATGYGWGAGAEWQDLVNIINAESGFNPNAQNPNSSAYGLFQFLDGTWGSVDIPKTSDPTQQTIAGLRYIAGKYGDPIGAWGFHLAHGWYDHGGGLAPGMTLAMNGTGQTETITPANEMRDVVAELRGVRAALEQNGIKVRAMPDLSGQMAGVAQGTYEANRNWVGHR